MLGRFSLCFLPARCLAYSVGHNDCDWTGVPKTEVLKELRFCVAHAALPKELLRRGNYSSATILGSKVSTNAVGFNPERGVPFVL
jgi:hypothetical protein